MGFRSDTMRCVAGPAALGFMLAAAGCQSSDVLNPGPGQGSGGRAIAAAPPPGTEKISAAELRAYCPKVTLREGTAYFNTYAKAAKKPAKTDDLADSAKAGPGSDSIIYQASVVDVTRSCTYSPGQMTINVAVAGKVIPGPKGVAGTITMPIRIVVMDAGTVIYTKLHQYQVALPDAANSVQFVFNDPDVIVPQPTTANYRVYAGFDEGPEKPKKTASAE